MSCDDWVCHLLLLLLLSSSSCFYCCCGCCCGRFQQLELFQIHYIKLHYITLDWFGLVWFGIRFHSIQFNLIQFDWIGLDSITYCSLRRNTYSMQLLMSKPPHKLRYEVVLRSFVLFRSLSPSLVIFVVCVHVYMCACVCVLIEVPKWWKNDRDQRKWLLINEKPYWSLSGTNDVVNSVNQRILGIKPW